MARNFTVKGASTASSKTLTEFQYMFIVDEVEDLVVLQTKNKAYSLTSSINPGSIYSIQEIDNMIEELTNNLAMDLSTYYDKSEIDNLFSNISETLEVDLTPYYNKTEVDTIISNITTDLTNYYTKAETSDNFYTKSEVTNMLNELTSNFNNIAEDLGNINLSLFETILSNNDKLDNKVDKEAGKGLSTNDFTTAHKDKLDGIDDDINTKIDSSIDILLDGAPDTFSTLRSIAEWIENEGVAATELSNSLANKATIADLNLKADKTELLPLATKTELNLKADKTELLSYATKAELLAKADKTELSTKADRTELATLATKSELTNLATKTELNTKADKTELTNLATKTELNLKADKTQLTALATKAELANYANNTYVNTKVNELKPVRTTVNGWTKIEYTDQIVYRIKKSFTQFIGRDNAGWATLNTGTTFPSTSINMSTSDHFNFSINNNSRVVAIMVQNNTSQVVLGMRNMYLQGDANCSGFWTMELIFYK